MQLYEAIDKGSIHLDSNFFPDNIWKDIFYDLKQVQFNQTYQPSGFNYYNRLEAYPTNEYWYNKYNDFIINKVQNSLGCKIKNFDCFARKLIKSEIQKSPQGQCKYGTVHKDDSEYSAVISLDESTNGGTAFYEHHHHRYPNSEIGAYPNRLVLYSGSKFHSTCYDFNLDQSIKLVFFCDRDRENNVV